MPLNVALIVVFGCSLVRLAAATAPGPDDAHWNLADWLVSEPPARSSHQSIVANNDSRRNWVVTLDGGKPVASLVANVRILNPLPPAIEPAANPLSSKGGRIATRVVDGWIASFNSGEFGGSVWWYSEDGKDRYQVSKENIEGFISTKAGLLMLEGLAHLSLDRGSLKRLVQGKDGHWASEPFVDLGSCPLVALKETDDSLLVVTHERFSKVNLATKRVEVLVDHAFWQSLYPNSIVVDQAGQVFIGMRHGVARLDGVGPSPKIDWLLPSKAVADEKRVPGFR